MGSPKQYFSTLFQITQACPFLCDICLRYYDPYQKPLSPEERRQMMDILKDLGLGRICISGGEPMMLGEETLSLLRYAHNLHIHTSLSTTGYNLDESTIKNMDQYVDHLLISVRSIDKANWTKDFGGTKKAGKLFDTVFKILEWIQKTEIIVEVETAVHRENLDRIVNIGWRLLDINPYVAWKIVEYCPVGLRSNNSSRFELGDHQFDQLCSKITNIFGNLFPRISFISKQKRINLPSSLIDSNGKVLNHITYSPTPFYIIDGSLPPKFYSIRPWSVHKLNCRDWGWGDL